MPNWRYRSLGGREDGLCKSAKFIGWLRYYCLGECGLESAGEGLQASIGTARGRLLSDSAGLGARVLAGGVWGVCKSTI